MNEWEKREGKRARDKTRILNFNFYVTIYSFKNTRGRKLVKSSYINGYMQEKREGDARRKNNGGPRRLSRFFISLMFSPVLSSPASILFSVSICHLRTGHATCWHTRAKMESRERESPLPLSTLIPSPSDFVSYK